MRQVVANQRARSRTIVYYTFVSADRHDGRRLERVIIHYNCSSKTVLFGRKRVVWEIIYAECLLNHLHVNFHKNCLKYELKKHVFTMFALILSNICFGFALKRSVSLLGIYGGKSHQVHMNVRLRFCAQRCIIIGLDGRVFNGLDRYLLDAMRGQRSSVWGPWDNTRPRIRINNIV